MDAYIPLYLGRMESFTRFLFPPHKEKNTPQARRIARNALDEKIADILSRKTKKTLSELILMYLESKGREAVNDVETMRTPSVRSWSCSVMWFVSDLTTPMAKRTFLECDKPVSTKNRYILLLNNFLRWCHEYGYTSGSSSICPSEKDKTKPKDAGDLYLEAPELKDLLDKASTELWTDISAGSWLWPVAVSVKLLLLPLEGYYRQVHPDHEDVWSSEPPDQHTEDHDFRAWDLHPASSVRCSEIPRVADASTWWHGIRTDGSSPGREDITQRTTSAEAPEDHPKLHPHIFRHTHVAPGRTGTPLRLYQDASSLIRRSQEGIFSRNWKMKAKDEKALDQISILWSAPSLPRNTKKSTQKRALYLRLY